MFLLWLARSSCLSALDAPAAPAPPLKETRYNTLPPSLQNTSSPHPPLALVPAIVTGREAASLGKIRDVSGGVRNFLFEADMFVVVCYKFSV